MEDIWHFCLNVFYGMLSVIIYRSIKPLLASCFKGWLCSAVAMSLTLFTILAVSYLILIIFELDK